MQLKIKILASLLGLLGFSNIVQGQSWINEIHEISRQLLDDDLSREEKQALVIKFNTCMHGGIKENDFMRQSLEDAPIFQDIIAADSSFRILTAHASLDNDEYMYYGGIYDDKTKEFVPFRQKECTLEQFQNSVFNTEHWYGAVYYGSYTFRHEGEQVYLLFGLQNLDYFTRMKMIDVLYKENGEWKFGKKVFEYKTDMMVETDTLLRYFQVYAAEAPIVMNYDESEKMIVFDHLMPIKGIYPGQENAWVPDGTYSGFKWSKKYWRFVEKLENQVLNEAPRDFPVLDNRENRDILGRQKKQN